METRPGDGGEDGRELVAGLLAWTAGEPLQPQVEDERVHGTWEGGAEGWRGAEGRRRPRAHYRAGVRASR